MFCCVRNVKLRLSISYTWQLRKVMDDRKVLCVHCTMYSVHGFMKMKSLPEIHPLQLSGPYWNLSNQWLQVQPRYQSLQDGDISYCRHNCEVFLLKWPMNVKISMILLWNEVIADSNRLKLTDSTANGNKIRATNWIADKLRISIVKRRLTQSLLYAADLLFKFIY